MKTNLSKLAALINDPVEPPKTKAEYKDQAQAKRWTARFVETPFKAITIFDKLDIESLVRPDKKDGA